MQSALIVHSKHTKNFAQRLARKYKEVLFLEVVKPPTEEVLNIKNNKDIVIGVGGGSVIDTAKIISKDKRCIAIPTTAAGASMTPYATVWGRRKKISVPTKKPILKMDYNIPKNLPYSVRQSTAFDALSHAIESFWSKNATSQSKRYSRKALYLIKKYLKNKNDIGMLINAGNLAGQAIAITKTNVVHAASYTLTTEYGIEHGTACGMLLPYFIEYMNFEKLPQLFNLDFTADLVTFLKKIYKFPTVRDVDIGLVARESLKYERINDGPKKIDKDVLIRILKKVFAKKAES